ncbi:MAG TPA: hypothetical protein VFS20_14775 [Longimicrobium sp.]|nr:hypothetical protein [Longimicrobium sp.]
MRLKALLAFAALLFVTACTADSTGPSTSRTPAVERADGGGNGQFGSGG